MPDLFVLDPQTLATVENGIDSLIHQLGKMCKIIYSTDQTTPCPNCIFNPTLGRSTGVYNGTGPRPFTGGRCPICHGTGTIASQAENNDVVQLLIDWQPKPWLFFNPNDTSLHIPQGLVQTKGFVADLPKIMQANYLIVDYKNAIYETNRFVRWNEPVLQGNIVKSKFFLCFWQRYQS